MDVAVLMQFAGRLVGRVQELAEERVVRFDARLEGVVGHAVELEALQQAVIRQVETVTRFLVETVPAGRPLRL